MRRSELTFLALAVSLLAASAAGWIGRLGVEYDEAHFLPAAVKLARGSPELLKPPAGIYVAHRPIPFMTMAYVGGLDVLIYAVPYAIFGTHALVHRVTNLLLGCVVLLLAYALARRLHSPLAGAFTVILLLLDLEFLLHVPTNFGPFLLQMICGTAAALLLLAPGVTRRTPWNIVLAAFLLGLGIQEKLTFVWVIAGLLGGCLIYLPSIWQASHWTSWVAVPLAAAGGMAPALWYAWGFPQVVFGYARSSADVTHWSLVWSQRVQQLRLLLDGQFTASFLLGGVAPPIGRFSYLFWLILAALFTLVLGWLLRYSPPRAAWFAALYSAVFFACNLVFPEAGRLHHFLLLAPILQIGMGSALAWWWEARWVRAPLVALLLCTGWSTARNLQWFQSEVARTGGGIHWSAQINDLVRWAAAHPQLHFYTASWGLSRQLMTFPADTLSVHERYYQLLGDRDSELKASLPRRDAIWLFSSALPLYLEQRELVFASARGLGHSPRLVARVGTLYEAYSFLPEEPETAWQPVPVQSTRAGVVTLSGDATRFRFTVEGEWKAMSSLHAELLDAEGKVLESYFRPFEYYPPIEPRLTLEFGPSLYPDYFVQAHRVSGPVHSLRISSEDGAPIQVTGASIRR